MVTRRTPVMDGRAMLRAHAKGFEAMDGAANPRGEHWVTRDGDPVFVPYSGPPFTGQHFDTEALEEILDLD